MARHDQKVAVALAMRTVDKLPALPAVVTLTRVGPRKQDDDNLSGSGKYLRDQIAAEFGEDDGSPKYVWQNKQRIGAWP